MIRPATNDTQVHGKVVGDLTGQVENKLEKIEVNTTLRPHFLLSFQMFRVQTKSR